MSNPNPNDPYPAGLAALLTALAVAAVIVLLLLGLAACAPPCCEAQARAVPPTPAALAPVGVDAPALCAPSAIQPSDGALLIPLGRVRGCPGLIRVEWRGAELLVLAETLIADGLSAETLAALPEVR